MNSRQISRIRKHIRVRKRIAGTSSVPRLCIFRGLKNIHAQVIDDTQNKVLAVASTAEKDFKQKFPSRGNIEAAAGLGELIASRAKEKGIAKVIFDRGGWLYHGRIKALAEAARKAGLQF